MAFLQVLCLQMCRRNGWRDYSEPRDCCNRILGQGSYATMANVRKNGSVKDFGPRMEQPDLASDCEIPLVKMRHAISWGISMHAASLPAELRTNCHELCARVRCHAPPAAPITTNSRSVPSSASTSR